MYRPALVKCLLHEHVVDISCGSSHTAVRTRLDYSLKEGVEKARDTATATATATPIAQLCLRG